LSKHNNINPDCEPVVPLTVSFSYAVKFLRKYFIHKTSETRME